MGAESFIKEVIATSAREGYEILKKNALRYHGCSGESFASCSFGGITKVIEGKYKKENDDIAYKHIDDMHNGDKYIAKCVNLGLVGYRVVTVEEEVVKHGTPRSVYVIYNDKEKVDYDYDKLKAKAIAMAYAKKNPDSKLRIRREVVYSNRENDDLYRYKTSSKIIERKIKGKKNESVEPVYRFYFYGFTNY